MSYILVFLKIPSILSASKIIIFLEYLSHDYFWKYYPDKCLIFFMNGSVKTSLYHY